jgi:osmotically inducible lipoprotein OsmB
MLSINQKELDMKTRFAIVALCAATLSACNAYSPTDRAVTGGLVGAGAGAVIGGVATGRAGGALAGAAIGGASGAIIGAATTPASPRYARTCRGYDAYGNPVAYAC